MNSRREFLGSLGPLALVSGMIGGGIILNREDRPNDVDYIEAGVTPGWEYIKLITVDDRPVFDIRNRPFNDKKDLAITIADARNGFIDYIVGPKNNQRTRTIRGKVGIWYS